MSHPAGELPPGFPPQPRPTAPIGEWLGRPRRLASRLEQHLVQPGIIRPVPELRDPAVPRGRLSNQVQPRIDARNLVLRPWSPEDVASLVEAYDDGEIQRWHVRTMDESEALGWVEERTGRWGLETGAEWAVVERGAVVGRVGFCGLDLVDGRGEAAYWVMPAFRGRGIAVQALRAASAWMLEAGFHRLEILHSTRNDLSCRVAIAAGYEIEGTQSRSTLHADGWHDMHVHVLLAGDDRRMARYATPIGDPG